VTKPEIIGSAQSSYTRLVRMVCEEKGIDYALTEALLGAPEIFAIHPFGRMPVLRHGDFTLFESKAIATYLDRAFPGPALIPSDPKLAALTEQWVSLVNTAMDPMLVRTYLLAMPSQERPTASRIVRPSRRSGQKRGSSLRCWTRQSPPPAISLATA
jgi:glutathione S-transferase